MFSAFFIDRPRFAIVNAIIITLAGIIAITRIPVAQFPNIVPPQVQVTVNYPGASAKVVEQTVAEPIEEAVNGLNDEIYMSSTSANDGSYSLTVSFAVGSDPNIDTVNVTNAVQQATSQLPALVQQEGITVRKRSSAVLDFLFISSPGNQLSQLQVSNYVTLNLLDPLSRVQGVGQALLFGPQNYSMRVYYDTNRLTQLGLTPQDIITALNGQNVQAPVGAIGVPPNAATQQLQMTVEAQGRLTTVEQFGDVVLRTNPDGSLLRIKDVAQVVLGAQTQTRINKIDNGAGQAIGIYLAPGANALATSAAVDQELALLEQKFPPSLIATHVFDTSSFVRETIQEVERTLLAAFVLVVLVVFLFLGDWRAAVVPTVVLPIALTGTFAVLLACGFSANTVTLLALVVATGIVVDDAIVVVENIVMHRDRGQTRAEAIRSAIREIRVPLVGSTVTPIVVFLPLISITGVEGVFFRALALTVTIALVTSLALALTWTPTLSHYFIRSRGRRRRSEELDEAPSRGMRVYGTVLRFTLEHRLALALFTVVLIGASYVCYSRLGSDLLPEMDEGGFVLDYIMPAGSSLEATNRVITQVEQLLRTTPEVESTSRRTGLQLGLAAVTEANYGDILVKLKRQRDRGVEEVIADVRARVRQAEPVLDIEFTQVLQDMIGDLTSAPEPCIIKLFSNDPDALRRWAPETAKAIGKIHGVVDVLDGIENTISGPATVFNVDPVVAARAGFSPQEVEVDASAILQGEAAATPVVVNDRAYTIRVRFPERTRATLDAIRDTVLVSGTGKTASIGSLAGMVQIPGQTEIRRENLQRDVQVTARFEGLNLGEGMDQVQQAVRDLHIPSNIRVAYGGQYEEQQKSFRELVVVLLLAILLVFLVLLFEFGSFAAPAAVLASAILSTSGVFLALLVTGTTFNLSSFMGLIMVIGIVAKNGILLLDADQKFRAAGVPAEESMLRAGERRLRPILMTALATVAGMVPLALAWGAGSQMLQPLAIAVIGGILASMVLSLVVTPAVRYYLEAK